MQSSVLISDPRYAVDVDQETLKEAVKEVADMFLADVIRYQHHPSSLVILPKLVPFLMDTSLTPGRES